MFFINIKLVKIIMKFKKEILLSVFSIFTFILFFEIGLRITGFDYHHTYIGFNISDNDKIFDLSGGYYATRKQQEDIFTYQKFLVNKPKNEFRIFILGGSSVRNLHFFSDLNYLKDKLEKSIGNKQVRIITIGADGYGTNRLLLHLPEVLGYEPDLIIVYSGHNEFWETFIMKNFTDTPLSRLNNKLIEVSKLYQLESVAINKIIKFTLDQREKKQHPLFSSYPKIDLDLEFNKTNVYRNYENNIIKMIKLAKEKNVDVIISTVAYNRMIPPFKPADSYYNFCDSLFKQKKFDEALVCFDQALDSDLQPHRASKTSNEIIKNISKTYKIPLADVDQKIVKSSKYNIPGLDLFYDTTHLNYDGNKILLDVFYGAITDNGLLSQ
nr:hypothetical protein [uncultured archaeon]